MSHLDGFSDAAVGEIVGIRALRDVILISSPHNFNNKVLGSGSGCERESLSGLDPAQPLLACTVCVIRLDSVSILSRH